MWDVTVILNCHDEGSLMFVAAESVRLALDELELIGKTGHCLLVLDKPDIASKNAALQITSLDGRFSESIVNFGDLGLSRNFGIKASNSSFIAFIDGDDFWGKDWLRSAYGFAIREPGVVWHPEISYYFGSSITRKSSIVMQHVNSKSAAFDKFTLASSNYWTSACFASKDVFERIPYRAVSSQKRLGFEDWTFNMEVIQSGLSHGVVENTIHFIRDKVLGSMRNVHSSYRAMPHAIPFLVSKAHGLANP